MQIEKKGNGPWADVSVSCGAVSIAVGEEVLLLNCNALQQDSQMFIDIVRGANGSLVRGVENGSEYVASLILPPARYKDVPAPEGSSSGMGSESTVQERIPLDETLAAVRLVLWTVTDNQEL